MSRRVLIAIGVVFMIALGGYLPAGFSRCSGQAYHDHLVD